MNVPLTALFAVILTVHVPVPEQSPPQPVKSEVDDGAADSVTLAPDVKLTEQVAPQFTPVGELVTVPEPVPDLV